MADRARARTTSAAATALLALLALAVRSLRINWQPLWWDEGYSAYFATESLARMVGLTAHDIHPPLYYGLLHGWLRLLNGQDPVALRSFSVLLGVLAIPAMAWLADSLFPGRTRIIVLATLLLALNPMHLYYSQEVRMYGLALALSVVATTLFWRLVQRPTAWRFAGYVLAATLALHTLYYLGFLLLGHAIWGLWSQRRNARRLAWLAGAFAVTALLTLPWIVYAAPKLLGYVDDKVASDQDTPLNLLAYVGRFALAFTGGHLRAAEPLLRTATVFGLAGLILLAVAALVMILRGRGSRPTLVRGTGAVLPASPYGALWIFVLTPLICSYVLNVRLPFFPEGGERVLLYVLPYVLLLLAAAMDTTWEMYYLGKIAAAALLTSAVVGIVVFYTTPRYVERDYRPIIDQVLQQGQDTDTFFALFPWQLGYWRAYARPEKGAEVAGPKPLLVSDSAVVWDETVTAALDTSLDQGTVWFPAPLSFGSTLPGEIESYLADQAVNVENRWHGAATRLSAWRNLSRPEVSAQAINFGPVQLAGAAISAESLASENQAVAVALEWQPATNGEMLDDLTVTLRLRDERGRTWASRDYAPLGSLAHGSKPVKGVQIEETVGFIVPVGLAPDRYALSVGVGISGTQTLFYPTSDVPNSAVAEADPMAEIGELTVLPPSTLQSPVRLPIQTAIKPPEVRDGLAFLGHAGIDPDDAQLAGTDLALTLFLQNRRTESPARQLYVSLLDKKEGIGGWEGWPLPSYPTETWTEGALVQAPVSFYLPATLSAGAYELIAGLLDPATGEKSEPVSLGSISVKQRPANFSQPTMQHAIDPPVQFGTHARLIGYDLDRRPEALAMTLHWQVLQTLLPAHHLFVHVEDELGATLAQDDGPPTTTGGRAPTGSWLPDEFISTVHVIPMADGTDSSGTELLHVGIYNPAGNIRLPATVDSQVSGDAAEIVLSR